MIDKKQQLYQLVEKIPRGKVTTYGLLAKKLGFKSARIIGNWLHNNPDAPQIPCHRVVSIKGWLAANFVDGIKVQKQRLTAEGVEVVGYRLDLKKYLWKP